MSLSRRLAISLLGAGLLLLAVSTAHAQGPGTRPVLEHGDRGVALTAMRGDEIEEIPVRYIGTFADFAGPGHDLLLFELEGPVGEEIGVAAGMSGSPVYVGDTLVGALSYRMGALPRNAIAGVTPIEDVLDAGRSVGASPSDPTTRPIRTPVVASGLHPIVREWLEPQFAEHGLVVSAGGAGRHTGDTPAFRPGSPIGVGLVRGDMTLSATGTVTWVDEDRVYAFGHPFLSTGRTLLPMHTARVIHTLADRLGPVKLAEVGSEVGAIVDDRLTAIVGEQGRFAEMSPLTLNVHGAEYGDARFEYEIVRGTVLGPLLSGTVVANSLISNPAFDRRATMVARGTIRLAGLPDLPLRAVVAGDNAGNHAVAIASRLVGLLSTLRVNPFAPVVVESIELDVEVRPDVTIYNVESLVYDRRPLRPGETLEVGCVLRGYRGERERRTLRIRIPDEITDRRSIVLAVGGPERIEQVLGAPALRRFRSASSVAGMIEALAEQRAENELTAVIYEASRSIVADGADYEELPGTARRLLGGPGRPAGAARGGASLLGRFELPLDGPVVGGIVVRLQIEPGSGPEDDR